MTSWLLRLSLSGLLPLHIITMDAHAVGAPVRTFDVLHYNAQLTPDIPRRELVGQVEITLKSVANGTGELLFDAGGLQIGAVSSRGIALAHERVGTQLRIVLDVPLRRGQIRRIRIDYHGSPRFGLEFQPEREEVYTIFSTSQWMPCIDAPDERATLDLSVRLPIGLVAAGTGRSLATSEPSIHRWRLDTPMPSYVYGFAAGRYEEVSDSVDGIDLRYLSSVRTPEELRKVFAETSDMLGFFSQRAGLPWRGPYTQVLVTKTIGQELAGLSLLSEPYGQRVLDDPGNVALIAHEAAHQWWGNQVTCRDWRHFWLNEGFANFMAAAWQEQRFGAEAYARQVATWRIRLERLRGEGKDHPLVYPDWDAPSTDDRAVVYQKGAYVLHLLREELGEDVFWRGIRYYTRQYTGKSVVTEDFQHAMEQSSGRDLGTFFERWVY